MSRRLRMTPAAALASLTLMGACFGQFSSQVMRGEVKGAGQYALLLVEVYDLSSHVVVERQPLTSSGAFEIRTTSSNFELRVTTPAGDIVSRADVNAVDRSAPVTIQLPEPRTRTPGGLVSVHDLKREGNKQLRKEFLAAQQAVDRGDLLTSAAHLERAVVIDPTYVPAYVNLGARYIQLRQPNRARAALLRAIELDPKILMAYTNLAVADMNLGDPVAAAAAATAALRISPDYPLANRLLADARRASTGVR